MTRSKFLAKSKTIQGAVIMLIPIVMQLFDVQWTEDQTAEINEAISAIIGAAGAVWVVIGRFTADSKITIKPGGGTGDGTSLKVQSVALFVAIAMTILVAGCANQIRPETARERLVVAEYAYQGALDEIEQAVRLGLLRGDEAAEASERLDTAFLALQSLRVATQTADLGDDFDAQAATDAALASLLTYLEATGAIEPLPPAEPEG